MFFLLALFAALIPQTGYAQPTAQMPSHIERVAMIGPDKKAVARIRADKRDCPACNLAGADLTNTCVKKGNLTGANFDHANATLMCMSYANFTNASFKDTILDGANLAHADLDGANFAGASLIATSFKGTDLRKAHGLTQAQLSKACGDADTKAPAGLKVRRCS